MRWVHHVRSGVRGIFQRGRVEQELDRELRFHVDQQTAEHIAAGMSPEEAARAARREFGSGALAADQVRESRGLHVLDSLARDTRYAARRLVRDWRFTAGAALILALGIGANTAVFSVVNAALFRPLPFSNASELVNIYQNSSEGQAAASSFPVYLDMAAHEDLFEETTAFSMPLPLPIKVGDVIRSGLVEFATSSYLQLVGRPPALGRWFTAQEDRDGGDPVAVIGYQAWRTRFGGSPSVIGTTVHVDTIPVTIIGVAPEGHNGSLTAGLVTEFWMSLSVLPRIDAAGPDPLGRTTLEPFFLVKARLRDGVAVPQVRAAMDALTVRLGREYPDVPSRGITVLPSNEVRVHPQIDMLLMPGASLLLILVGLLLAIACSNLATLLLVRGSSRAREVSLRLALGATRGQLVRLLLTESVVLAVAGGLGGYLLAEWAVRTLRAVDLPLVMDLRLDYRVLGFTLILSLATGLLFGLAPAIRATRVELVPELRNEGSAASSSHRWFTMKNGLIVAQVAASCLLLVAAGLVLRALLGAQRSSLDPGFDIDRLAFIEIDAGYAGYERDRAATLYEELRSRIAALPGIEAATLADGPPIGGNYGSRAIEVDGYVPARGEEVRARWGWAGPGYFETIGLPMIHGRSFSAFDTDETMPVAVINQMMAQRYFGTPNAVGRRFRIAGAGEVSDATTGVELQIVGVIPTVRTAVLDTTEPMFFRSFTQSPAATSVIVVRTEGAPEALLQSMQRVVRELDARLPVTAVATMPQHVSATLGVPRAAAGLLAGLGAIGLGLASVGLYAVVAFAVSRRALEIGIRMALGARRRQVIWAMSRDVAMLLGVGLVAGIVLSWAGVRALGVLAAQLSASPNLEIASPTADALTFVVVALLMSSVGLAATFFPARRAARTESLSALRHL